MTYLFLNRLTQLMFSLFILVPIGFSAEEEREFLEKEGRDLLHLKKPGLSLTLEDLNFEIKEKERQLHALKKQQTTFFTHQFQESGKDSLQTTNTLRPPTLNNIDGSPLSLEDLTRVYQEITAQLQIQLAQNQMLTQALADIASLREDIHSIKHHSAQQVYHRPAPTMLPFLLKKFIPTAGAFVLSTVAFYKTYGTATWIIKFVPMIIAPPLWAPLGVSLTVAGITYTGTIIGFKIL